MESNSLEPRPIPETEQIAYVSLEEARDDLEGLNKYSSNAPAFTLEKDEEFNKKVVSALKKVSNSTPLFKQTIKENTQEAIAYFDSLIIFFGSSSNLSRKEITERIDNPIFQILEENLDFLSDSADSTDSATFRTIFKLISESSEHDAKRKVAFLFNNFERFLSTIDQEEDGPDIYSLTLMPIFRHGSFEQVRYLRNFIYKKFSDMKSDPKDIAHLYLPMMLGELHAFPDPKVNMQAEFLMKEHIQYFFGMDYRSLWAAWFASNREGSGERMVANNYVALSKLEGQRPGIGAFLNEQFGIFDFDRYPSEILIRQYDERDNSNLKYGLLIYPYDDWNGAFYQDSETFRELAKQLGSDYITRIYEVKDTKDTLSAINDSRHKYGKSEFLIIGGHGSPGAIRLGIKEDEYITQEKLGRKGPNALQLAFVKNPTIILVSCSTGELGGIGEQISKLGSHGATVFAPDRPTSLKSIEVKKDQDGKLRFYVEYKDEGALRKYTKDKLE